MAVVRRQTPSVNTRLQKLRGATAFAAYATQVGGSLAERIESGRFFSLHEQLGFDTYLAATTGANSSTRAIRHRDGLAFVRYLWRRQAAFLADDHDTRFRYLGLAQEFSDEFYEIIPRSTGQGGSRRMGLSKEARIALAGFLLDPAAVTALWPDSFIAARNTLLVSCFAVMGHRVGELLSIRLCDLDLHARLYRVVRLHNSPSEPRAMQPLTKGRERELRWPATLVQMTNSYMKQRAKRPSAGSNNYLFLASEGDPMSRSLVSKIFDTLREHIPCLGERFSPHVLRHTWNDLFSEAADRAGLSAEAEMRARMLAMGWKSRATAVTYTRRFDAQVAEDISAEIQEDLFKTVGGSR